MVAMLAACAALTLVVTFLAVPRAAKAHRQARLFRAQQEWAEQLDRHEWPVGSAPWRARDARRTMAMADQTMTPPRTAPVRDQSGLRGCRTEH